MKVLVDSCVWSLALRHKSNQNEIAVHELTELILEARVQMIGAVRQEVLSGIKSVKQFQMLRSHLSAFADLTLSTADHELAAEYFNFCRRKGIQGANTDFLICAVSTNNSMPIFTQDNDFVHFKRHIPIILHKNRGL